MSNVIIVKNECGKVVGFGEKGARAWNRFTTAVRELEIGETLEFKWQKPRSPKFHRLYFAMLHALFDMQEQFSDMDALRAWLTVGAGYCEFVPGPKGRMVALPKSIACHAMEDTEFSDLVLATREFIVTTYATRFLWPHLSDEKSHETVSGMLAKFFE